MKWMKRKHLSTLWRFLRFFNRVIYDQKIFNKIFRRPETNKREAHIGKSNFKNFHIPNNSRLGVVVAVKRAGGALKQTFLRVRILTLSLPYMLSLMHWHCIRFKNSLCDWIRFLFKKNNHISIKNNIYTYKKETPIW